MEQEKECISVEHAAIKYDSENFGWPTPDKSVIMSEEKTREWNINAFKAGAQWQKEQLHPEKAELIKALQSIAAWPGNLPDDSYTTRTGPNDAVSRGLMVITMRAIARETLKKLNL